MGKREELQNSHLDLVDTIKRLNSYGNYLKLTSKAEQLEKLVQFAYKCTHCFVLVLD